MRKVLVIAGGVALLLALSTVLYQIGGPAGAGRAFAQDDTKSTSTKELSPEAQQAITDAGTAVMSALKTLRKDGAYRCCIEPGCAMCVLAGGCPCAKQLTGGLPVCPECFGGWWGGVGRLEASEFNHDPNNPTVNGRSLQIYSPSKLKTLYGARAKGLTAGGGGGEANEEVGNEAPPKKVPPQRTPARKKSSAAKKKPSKRAAESDEDTGQ